MTSRGHGVETLVVAEVRSCRFSMSFDTQGTAENSSPVEDAISLQRDAANESRRRRGVSLGHRLLVVVVVVVVLVESLQGFDRQHRIVFPALHLDPSPRTLRFVVDHTI